MLSIQIKYIFVSVVMMITTIVIEAQTSYIQVVSEPGISVFLDGEFKKTTNSEMGGLIIENVSPGLHTIRVIKDGFSPQEERLNIKQGEVYTYKVKSFAPKITISQEGNVSHQNVELKVGKLKIQSVPVSITISLPSLGLRDQKTIDEWIAYDIPEGEYDAIFIWNNKEIKDRIRIGDNQLTSLFVNMIEGKIDDRSPDYTHNESGTFIDPRDGFTYKTVTINDQTWMSQNLNFYNKDGIYKSFISCYDNDQSNCQKYGKLYDWYYAMKSCPTGWHLPSNEEWNTLITSLGGNDVAGSKLKSVTGWNDSKSNVLENPRVDDNNQSGFSALPAGLKKNFQGNSFYMGSGDKSNYGVWWSSSTGNVEKREIHISYLMTDYFKEIKQDDNDDYCQLSVRCIKDK